MAALRRAWVIGSGNNGAGADLAFALLARRQNAEARAIAARFHESARPPTRALGAIIDVAVLGAEARFGAARDAALALITTLERFGDFEPQDIYLVYLLPAIDGLVGSSATADAFAERFVLADPPRLGPVSWTLRGATLACWTAQRTTARRCFDRLQELHAAGAFPTASPGSAEMLAAARAFVGGDARAAARRLKPLADGMASSEGGLAILFAQVFDAAGEPELADRVDQRLARWDGQWNGADLAHARIAVRAARRGDHETAEKLAQRVITAWSSADVDVSIVPQMRSLRKNAK